MWQTHRVTAVLGSLASIAPIIVSEKRWLGGQKHLMPLLELTIPGIDINDPTKVKVSPNIDFHLTLTKFLFGCRLWVPVETRLSIFPANYDLGLRPRIHRCGAS